jgi:hypothetical protein
MRKIIHKVKGWINGRTPAVVTASNAAFVYIIKPGKHDGADGGGDQVAILRRFATFNEKEGIPVTAVFPGRPTRKVPDGAREGGVVARYAGAEGLMKVAQQAIKDLRKAHAVIVITDLPDIVKQVSADGCTVMCTSTFEKTLEAIAGPLQRPPREPREPRGPREPREPREQRKSGTEPSPDESQALDASEDENENQEAPPARAPAAAPLSRKSQYEPNVEKKEQDRAILDLIDPL